MEDIVIKMLLWDDWNVAHIAEHGIMPEEVEEISSSDLMIQQGRKGRLAVTGITKADRMITVILDSEAEEGVYYVVTAYPTNKKYRKIYQQEKGGEKSA